MSTCDETSRVTYGHTDPALAVLVGKQWPSRITSLKLIARVVAFGFACILIPQAAAQTTGNYSFDAEADDITGAVTCADGSVSTISPGVQDVTDQSGGNYRENSQEPITACGKTIASLSNGLAISDADDTTSQDGGFGEINEGEGNLLGGIVSWRALQSALECDSTRAGNATCWAPTQFAALAIDGQQVAQNIVPGATYNLTNLTVLGSNCTGGELFTGQVTLQEVTQSANSTTESVDLVAIHLKGTSTCVGLPLGTTKYDLSVAGPYVQMNLVGDNEVPISNAGDQGSNVSEPSLINPWGTQLAYTDAPYAPPGTAGNYASYGLPAY